MDPICDWLDVTCPPDDVPEPGVVEVLNGAGGECVYVDSSGSHWRVGKGSIRFQYSNRFARISASGSALSELRALSLFADYLGALSQSVHQVTRLDAALDVARDAAPVIAGLRSLYPKACSLTRKSLPTKSILQVRSDGAESGSWYVGHRSSARVTARVYDKALEALDRRGEVLPPTTRYEITVRRDVGPTLRDADSPSPIFWEFASPSLITRRPSSIPRWRSGWGGPWSYDPPLRSVGAVLRSRVESSADVGALIDLAKGLGGEGQTYLLSLLRKRIETSFL